jgi:hypothetical protein
MKPSHSTQPYRKSTGRQPGLALKAMKRGRTGTGFNPMDVQRQIAKGGNAPRKVHAPVAKPEFAGGGLARRLNRTGNDRDGQIFRTVKGTSKSGVSGEYHVYAGGKRVFVADKGAHAPVVKGSKLAGKARRGRATG